MLEELNFRGFKAGLQDFCPSSGSEVITKTLLIYVYIIGCFMSHNPLKMTRMTIRI